MFFLLIERILYFRSIAILYMNKRKDVILLTLFRKKKEEENMFRKSPLYKYVSGESEDGSAVYELLGPLYIKNRLNFLNLFPDVQKMMTGYKNLANNRPEMNNVYDALSKRNDTISTSALRLLWDFVYNGYQTAFILKQYSQKRPDLPELTLEQMVEQTFHEEEYSQEELKLWKTPGFYFEQCIQRLFEQQNVLERPDDTKLMKFFCEFF